MELFLYLLFFLSGLVFIVLGILVLVNLVKKQWHKAKKLAFITLGVLILGVVSLLLIPRHDTTKLITDPNKAYEFINLAVASTGEAVYPGVAPTKISPAKAVGCDKDLADEGPIAYSEQRHFSSSVIYQYASNGPNTKALLKTVAAYWESKGYVVDRKEEFYNEPLIRANISNTSDNHDAIGAFSLYARHKEGDKYLVLSASAPCLDGRIENLNHTTSTQ